MTYISWLRVLRSEQNDCRNMYNLKSEFDKMKINAWFSKSESKICGIRFGDRNRIAEATFN